MKQEIEQKKYETNKEVEIKDVVLTMSKYQPDMIEKIRFLTDIGDITWKPIIEEEIKDAGLTRKVFNKMLYNDIPDKLREIGNQVELGRVIKAKVCYSIFDSEKDGKPVTYFFIRSLKEFNSWELV